MNVVLNAIEFIRLNVPNVIIVIIFLLLSALYVYFRRKREGKEEGRYGCSFYKRGEFNISMNRNVNSTIEN